MGNILTLPTQNKTTIITAITTVTLFTFLLRNALERKSERAKILESIYNERLNKNKNDNQVYLENP